MRKMWPHLVRLYWDPWYNVPVIKPRQEEIDLLYQLRLSEPGDARPAFPGDHRRLHLSIKNEFGDDAIYRRFLENRFVLLNKVPHWDIMYEVIVSGNVIGQLFYDPYRSTWRFRLTYQGAYLALQENLVDYVRANPPFYTDREINSSISTSSKQVLILDNKGEIRGLGEPGDNKILVTKVFHDRSRPVETSNKNPSLDDIIKHNEHGLEQLEERSIRFLERLKKRYAGLDHVVSYSGGKDSLVSLDLAVKALGDVKMIFNDTGLEMPETIRNVEIVSKHYGVDLYIASAGDIFWRSVDLFGPPGKDYRWCCKITKLVPIAKLTKTRWPSGAINILGQRAFESLDRAKSPLVWRNKWIPHMVSTTPIQYWSQLACWIYIFKHRLPYNKLYNEGFDRLGCYMCPSCALAEYDETRRLYPDLWSKWMNVLEIWRQRLNQPEEWIRFGLWRWLTPSTAKRRIIHYLPNYKLDWRDEYINRLRNNSTQFYPVEAKWTNDTLILKFNIELLPSEFKDSLLANLKHLGFEILSQEPVIASKDAYTVVINKDTISYTPANQQSIELLVDVLKLIYRIRGCVFCGSCVLWSKRGAVKLGKNGPVLLDSLDEKEKSIYIEVCPISDQLVEKLVVPLILSDYKAFKRKTRRKLSL